MTADLFIYLLIFKAHVFFVLTSHRQIICVYFFFSKACGKTTLGNYLTSILLQSVYLSHWGNSWAHPSLKKEYRWITEESCYWYRNTAWDYAIIARMEKKKHGRRVIIRMCHVGAKSRRNKTKRLNAILRYQWRRDTTIAQMEIYGGWGGYNHELLVILRQQLYLDIRRKKLGVNGSPRLGVRACVQTPVWVSYVCVSVNIVLRSSSSSRSSRALGLFIFFPDGRLLIK